VIVVDNNSHDNTREIALKFNDNFKFKYVLEMTRGIPYARNTGINNATGDIVAFIDDDCEANEDWLKNIEKPFIKDPNIGAVGGNLSYARVGEGSMIEEFYIKNMAARKNNKI
jgi:glycosyltransferase involved in cell wall biosynthesis